MQVRTVAKAPNGAFINEAKPRGGGKAEILTGFPPTGVTAIHLLLMTTWLFGAASKSSATLPPHLIGIVNANTAFAMDLYQRERMRPGNLFLSPYSISTVLAMTYTGARGQTAVEMGHVLRFSVPQAELSTAFAGLVHEMDVNHEAGPLKLDVANSLWCQEGFPIISEFLQQAHRDFEAEAREVDFTKQAEPARHQINSWIAQKTQDKIKELFQPGQLPADTRLVLCNAIYFKGNWMTQFDPKATQSAPFFISAGKQLQVPFMTKTFGLHSRTIKDLTVLTLPYVSNELSMVILLPGNIDGLAAVEQEINPANLRQWLTAVDSAPAQKTELYLPKFKLDCRLDLTPTLSAMGMHLALSRKADFTGISTTPGLYISEVVHQAYVDVNEEGTEAAAATGTALRLASAVERIPVLRVDHPFVFLIRDSRTGSILFLGRVMDPSGQ